MAVGRQQIPVDDEPIGDFGRASVPVRLSKIWYRFFLACDGLLAAFQNGVLGFTVNNAVAAAGATQGTAAKLDTEWAVITSGPVNGGVVLSSFGEGVPGTVINQSGSNKNVYPPTGGQIDALGLNAPYPLANTKTQVFNQVSATQWYSTQLG